MDQIFTRFAHRLIIALKRLATGFSILSDAMFDDQDKTSNQKADRPKRH